MTDISTDRMGNLAIWPDFLPERTHDERSVWRFVLFLVVAAPVLIACLVIGGALSPAIGSALLALGGEPMSYWDAWQVMGRTMEGEVHGLAGEIMLVVTLGTMFGVASAGILVALKLFYHRPVRTWTTAAPRFRWRLFLLGVVAYGLVCGVLLGLTAVFQPGLLEPPVLDQTETIRLRAVYVAALLLFLPLAAAFEEILCRGWMMQQTAAWTRNVALILLVNAVIFSAIHLDPDPGRNVARLAMGLAFSWGALRLGGLEFSMGAHTINNVALALFATTLSRATDVHQASRVIDVIADLGGSAALIAAVEIAARVEPFRRWAKATQP